MKASKLLVAFLFVVLMNLGCSKSNSGSSVRRADEGRANVAPKVEWLANVTFGSFFGPAVKRQYGVSTETTCIQLAKVTTGTEVKRVAYVADIPCPAKNALLDPKSALPMQFSVSEFANGNATVTEAQSGAPVFRVYQSGNETLLAEFCTGDLQGIRSEPVRGTESNPYFGCDIEQIDGNIEKINLYFH